MEAVESLNYAPNFGARAIAANRTGIFGVVIPTMENAIFAKGVEAFQNVLLSKNATMLVASSNYSPEQEARQIRTLVGRGADGLLLIGFQRDPKIYSFLSEQEIPVVSAWASTKDANQSYVGFDNRTASAKLVRKALALGHENIAYVSAPSAGNDRAAQRVLGARDAIGEARLKPDNMLVVETDYSIHNGGEAFRSIVKQMDEIPPTLIVCGNDVLAVGVVQAAQEDGYRVPEDISVVGFDNIEISTVVSPALTTVDVPHHDMGRIAAETLYDLVQNPSDPIQVDLETRMIERQSLGKPRR